MYKNCCDLRSFSPTALYITKNVREESCCSRLFPFGGGLVIWFLLICPFSLPFIGTFFLYKLGRRKIDAVLFGIQVDLNIMNYQRLDLQSIFQSTTLNLTSTERASFSTALHNTAPRNTIQVTTSPLAPATIQGMRV